MWPDRRPGRGSGASPAKRSAERASTICALSSVTAMRTSASMATAPTFISALNVRRPLGVAGFQRPALGFPFRQAAVEDDKRSSRRRSGRSTRRAPPKKVRVLS